MESAVTTASAEPALAEAVAVPEPLMVVPEALAAPALERAWPRLKTAETWALSALGVDVAMLLLAAVGTVVGARLANIAAPPVAWLVFSTLLTLFLFAARGLYRLGFRLKTLDDLRVVAGATTLAAMITLSLRALLGDPSLAAESIRPYAFALVYLAAGRVALNWSQTKAREAGDNLRSTVIVGAGSVGCLVAKRLLDAPELGLRPVGFLDKEPLFDPAETLGLPVLGASWDLEGAIAKHGVEQVIVTFSTAPDEVLLALVRRCEELGVDVAIVPRLFERIPQRLGIEHLGGLPLVTPHAVDPRGWQFAVKYVLDRILAAIFILLALPILLFSALAVLVTMGRPVFYGQERVGRDGRLFKILKLRSMRIPDDVPEPAPLIPGCAPGGVEGEDRRTRLGAFLRATSIDELPQLVNVVRGEMSLVGPRPERPEFVSEFERTVYRYGERHRVKSGITGWAQVHGLRGKTSIADRAEWDNFYVENFSLWLDFKILSLTAVTVARGRRDVE
jgi:exopolysaccharide biosynthesis polyprenyl glycosylphosphotransferase